MGNLTVLQVVAILILLLLIYLLYRFFISIRRSKRLEEYAIAYKDDHFNLEYKLWKQIHRISIILGKIKLLNVFSKKYEKYIKEEDKKWKSGMDFITIKILMTILFILLYLFELMLHNLNFNWILFVLIGFLGFILIDVLCKLEYKRKKKYVETDLLKAVLIMENCYKANMNHKQAIENVISKMDGPIKEEFIHIKVDIEHGMNIGLAFNRMYERTKLKDVLWISNVLALVCQSGSNIIDAFSEIEKNIIGREKDKIDIQVLKNTNQVIKIVCYLLPLLFFCLMIFIEKDFLLLLFASKYRFIVIGCELLIYVIYIYILNYLARRQEDAR